MSPVDDLSPDQRAVLQLLLKQGKRYEELAALLRIDASAVRQRAVAALDALGPETDVAAGRRAELTDWLLGQQDPAESRRTVEYLVDAYPARAWAAAVHQELDAAGLGGDRLPEVPQTEVDAALVAAAERAETEERPPDSPTAEPATGPETGPEADARMPGFGAAPDADGGRAPASKLGGALLLAGIVIVIAVALVWAFSQGDDDGSDTATVAQTQTTATSSTSTTPSEEPRIAGQVNLHAPDGGKALGVANILAQGDQRAVAIQGQDLQPNTKRDAYAVWLAGGPGGKVTRLGFAPAVGPKGRLQGATALPDDAADYRRLVISLETAGDPAKPTDVVLTGRMRIR
ncbi:MAG TPA: hypothetical protein VFR97_06540 [Capillimicrobium sp.]|nr:hypothetical protein [Capillimicrobium sp.]